MLKTANRIELQSGEILTMPNLPGVVKVGTIYTKTKDRRIRTLMLNLSKHPFRNIKSN